MEELYTLGRLDSVSNNLARIISVVDAVLDGKVELTTDPALGNPVDGIWNIEHNLLKFLSSELDAIYALARDEIVRSAPDFEGVVYHV